MARDTNPAPDAAEDETTARMEGEDIVDQEFEGLSDGDAEAEGTAAEDESGDADSGDTIAITSGDEEHLLDDGDEEEAPADGRARNPDGTFAAKKEGDAPAAAAAPAAPAAEPASEWRPFQVKVNKAFVPIEEAHVREVKDPAGNEFVVFTVPKAQSGRFHDRIARGHLFEAKQREITTYEQKLKSGIAELERERELEKDAPALESDEQIEARLVLAEIGRKLRERATEDGIDIPEGKSPFLYLFNPIEVENLELKVARAQSDAKTKHETDRKTYFEEKNKPIREAEAAQEEEKTVVESLLGGVFDVLGSDDPRVKDLEGITREEIKSATDQLLRLRREQGVGAIWKESDGYYLNTTLIFEALKAARTSRAPASTAAAPSPKEPTATAPKPAAGKDPAERFNDGANKAPKPQSTSLRDRRNPRPRDERPTRERARVGGEDEVQKPAAMRQEDAWRKSTRGFLNSPGLDFEEDDEG